jgi:hypothetical protein
LSRRSSPGTTVSAMRYDPFGERISPAGPGWRNGNHPGRLTGQAFTGLSDWREPHVIGLD